MWAVSASRGRLLLTSFTDASRLLLMPIDARLAPNHTNSADPSRMIVAPSSSATRQSCEVPIERRSRPLAAASSARRAKCGREASGSSANGGIVIRPDDADRAAGDEVGELGGRDAPLPLLFGDVDLDQHLGLGRAVAAELLERRVGADRVDQPHQRQDLLDLAALQVADEVPGEVVGVAPRAWRRGPAGGSRRPG